MFSDSIWHFQKFQENNTTVQNEQEFQNFDLTDYRRVVKDLALRIYKVRNHLLDCLDIKSKL